MSSVFSPTVQMLQLPDTPLVTTLVPGTPALFTAGAQQLQWFSFNLPQAQMQLTLTLSPTSAAGSADILLAPASAGLSPPFVDQVSAVWTANSSSSPETITVLPSDPYYTYALYDRAHVGRQAGMAGQYFVTVLALQAGSFSLSLSLLDLTNVSAPLLDLEQGSIASVNGSLSSIAYYRFQVAQSVDLNTSDLVVALSSACADVFLSDVIATPGPSSPYSQVYSSVQTGDDVLVLSSGSYGELHSGWYWVGVAPQSATSVPCRFSLAVYLDVRTQLTATSGVQQGGALPAGGLRYYDFFAPESAVISCRVLVTAGSSPIGVYVTFSLNTLSTGVRPPYPDPSPYSPVSYSSSGLSNGSLPVLAVLTGNYGPFNAYAEYCDGLYGCYFTIGVFAPVGLASYSIDVQPFTASALVLNNSQPAALSLGLDQSADLSYDLRHAADCSIELQLQSYSVPGSLGVLLCILLPLGQTFVTADDGALGCNWELLVEPGVTAAASVSFTPFEPSVTGAPAGYYNVNGSSMTGLYTLLAVSFLPGNQSQAAQAAAANVSADFTVTQSCLRNNAAPPPLLNAPLQPSVPLTQAATTALSVFYVLDLSAVTITPSTDVAIYVTMQQLTNAGDVPQPVLSYSQTEQFPELTYGYGTLRTDNSALQLLLNSANTANLSSSPLYLRVSLLPDVDDGVNPLLLLERLTVLATITQRISLPGSGQSLSFSASPSSPFQWFTLLVPTVSNYTSAIFSIAAATPTAAPVMLVFQSPTVDPSMTNGGTNWDRALGIGNAIPYPAGGPIVFNNESCQAQDGSCRYSVLVYTPTPTAYTLLVSGAEDDALPAPITTLTTEAPATGSLPAAGTAFYSFNVTVPAGQVNLTLTVSSGVADMFVSAVAGLGLAGYTDPSWFASNRPQFWTSGSAAVKLIGFDSSSEQWTLEGQYYVTVFAPSACSYSLQLSVVAFAPPDVAITPLFNRVQLNSSVGFEGLSVYSFQMDGSLGANSDVVVLLMPNLALTDPQEPDFLELSVSTAWPFASSYWVSSLKDVPSSPLAVTLNANIGPECEVCPEYNPLLNQTLYITVVPVYYFNGHYEGGAYSLTVTYAARIALRPGSPSYTSTGPLAVNTVQTFAYAPASSNVVPCSLYGAVSTLSHAPGIAALFVDSPGDGYTGVVPFSTLGGSYGEASTFASVSVQAIYVSEYCFYDYYYPAACVWYFQVLALQPVSGYSFTVTDQPPSTPIIPGVPTAVTLRGAGCAEFTFSIPSAHGLSNLTFSAPTAPSSGIQLFLEDGNLLPNDYYFPPDADTAVWTAADISRQPLTITPYNPQFEVPYLYGKGDAGVSGSWYLTVCAQFPTTASLTVTTTDPLSSTPVQAVVNGSAVAGQAAAGSSFLAFVQVNNVNATARLQLQLTSSATTLVLYASPSFYPGPTALVTYGNFSLSPYETSARFSNKLAAYAPLTLSRVVGTGKIRLTPSTTYYIAVFNTGNVTASFSLSVTGSGVNLVAPPALVSSSSSSSSSCPGPRPPPSPRSRLPQQLQAALPQLPRPPPCLPLRSAAVARRPRVPRPLPPRRHPPPAPPPLPSHPLPLLPHRRLPQSHPQARRH